MSTNAPLIAAIEAGGTKFVCGIGTGPDDLRDVTRIDTTTPAATLEAVGQYLGRMAETHGPIAAIGVGSFGPVDLNHESRTYGYITSTPKPGWQQTDVVGFLKQRIQVPVGFDTDVNAAVLAEHLWGAGQNLDPLVYITVGTGMGGGVWVNGGLLHGALHPEIGHLAVPAPANSQAIVKECQCPFHKNCVEGYVSGPAIMKRWGIKGNDLPEDHPAWAEIADVMGHALMNLSLTLSPKRIILGGGVMSHPKIISMIRSRLVEQLNDYLLVPELKEGLDQYVVEPGLGSKSGLLGALALGRRAFGQKGTEG